MQAVLVGATGATGRELLQLLLADGSFTRVDIFVRRDPGVRHAKLHVHQVDFTRPDGWRHLVRGDVLFSCLGTTLKAAGSQAAQWQIDYTANLAFAQAARANGVQTLALVSSAGANAHSRFFYPRMKGELENALDTLHFSHLLIFRPPLLARPNSDRLGENLAECVFAALNAVGLFKSQRPLPVADLARAMLKAASNLPPGKVQIYPPAAIRAMLGD